MKDLKRFKFLGFFRGQSSVDFLMTYGWVVVVGVGAILILSQTGVFRPAPCDKTVVGFSQAAVLDWGTYRDSNSMLLKIENIAGDPIEVLAVNALIANVSCSLDGVEPIYLEPGADTFLKLSCGRNPSLSDLFNRGDCYKADIYISYLNKVTGSRDESRGRVRGVIEEGAATTTTTTTTSTTTTFDDAQYISQVVPQTMYVGETAQVRVVMKNNGTSTWTYTENYKLGSQNPEDNMQWGLNRVPLNPGETIPPESSKEFIYNIKAPDEPGDYIFQWRMIHGNTWFGQKTPETIIHVIRDNPPQVFLIEPCDCCDPNNNPIHGTPECP